MKRRDFIAFVGGAAVGWPIAARAQQAAMPVIGFLHSGSFDGYTNQAVAFRQGLNEAGFIPGQNVAIEYRWAATQYDQLPALAADLVGRQVAVLFAGGGQLAGLVASLNRPEGNLTGASFFNRALAPKRLELIRELLPTAIKIVVLDNPQNPWNATELASLKTAAAALGQQLSFLSASTVAEIDQAFVQLGQQRPDALMIGTDLLFTTQRQLVVALTARHRIPTIYPSEEYARAGGLISYGAPATAAYHQAGIYVGRVLKGANPADLPIVLPTKFKLVINLKTAKALGLTVADSFVLFRVDEVIE